MPPVSKGFAGTAAAGQRPQPLLLRRQREGGPGGTRVGGSVQAMLDFPTAPVVAAGLVGGFATARYSGRRELGGVVLGGAGALASRRWLRSSGPGVMGVLLGTYLVAFGASHPLAKKIGAWPSVAAVTTVAAGAAYALADRSHASF